MKVFNAFFGLYRTLLYIVVILYVCVALLPFAVGVRPYIVLSGSMEPTIHTGAVAYVHMSRSQSPFAKYYEYQEPEKDDVIAFESGDDDNSVIVIHRLKAINSDGTYTTKGDNNDSEDLSSVTADQVKGVYLFSIPKLGYFASWLQSTKGIVTAIVLILIAFISSFITDNTERSKKNKNDTEVNVNVTTGNEGLTMEQVKEIVNNSISNQDIRSDTDNNNNNNNFNSDTPPET